MNRIDADRRYVLAATNILSRQFDANLENFAHQWTSLEARKALAVFAVVCQHDSLFREAANAVNLAMQVYSRALNPSDARQQKIAELIIGSGIEAYRLDRVVETYPWMRREMRREIMQRGLSLGVELNRHNVAALEEGDKQDARWIGENLRRTNGRVDNVLREDSEPIFYISQIGDRTQVSFRDLKATHTTDIQRAVGLLLQNYPIKGDNGELFPLCESNFDISVFCATLYYMQDQRALLRVDQGVQFYAQTNTENRKAFGTSDSTIIRLINLIRRNRDLRRGLGISL